VDIGYHYLKVVSVFYVALAVMFCVNGLLRGAGSAVIPMYITLLSLWIVRIPLAYLLSRTFRFGSIWHLVVNSFGLAYGCYGINTILQVWNWKNKSVVTHATTDDDGVTTDIV